MKWFQLLQDAGMCWQPWEVAAKWIQQLPLKLADAVRFPPQNHETGPSWWCYSLYVLYQPRLIGTKCGKWIWSTR
ncbi:unnamed protein product [Prunus armeniaca]